jgi:hypothetical protein
MDAETVLALYRRYGIEPGEKRQAMDAAAAAERSGPGGAGGQNQPRVPRSDSAVVWKIHADNSMEPAKVSLGITDHSYTEVTALLKGELKEGDEVIIRTVMPKSSAPLRP